MLLGGISVKSWHMKAGKSFGVVWRGAKGTAEFCRFWRFSVSATRDWNGGIIAGFLYFSP